MSQAKWKCDSRVNLDVTFERYEDATIFRESIVIIFV